MLRFFHLAKKASPFISVGSINLLTDIGIFKGSLWGRPLLVKETLRSGCWVKSDWHSMLTICWNWAPASTVESTLFTCNCNDEVSSGPRVTTGWKFWKNAKKCHKFPHKIIYIESWLWNSYRPGQPNWDFDLVILHGGNLAIFLPLWFYMKSISLISDSQKRRFKNFEGFEFWF